MIRWGMLLFGVASTVLGVVGYLMHPPIPVNNQPLSVEQAIAEMADRNLMAIRLEGRPDFSQKAYAALSVRPLFAGRPTGETYEYRTAVEDDQGLES